MNNNKVKYLVNGLINDLKELTDLEEIIDTIYFTVSDLENLRENE